jgi:hypothetical protein
MSIYEALELLGLEQRATASEIKMAYREQVKRWHPDRFGGEPELTHEAEARLQKINRAYTVLQDYNPGPDTVYLQTGMSDVQTPLPLNVMPLGIRPSIAERHAQSRWVRTGWVSLAVLVITGIGFSLNRFVADDDDLSFAAAVAPAATAIRTSALSSPVITPALPLAASAIRQPTVFVPVAAPAAPADRPVIRRTLVMMPVLPSDPNVPDLALGDRLEVRSTCLSEASGGGQDSYSECFLRKLEEHPRPIHMMDDSGERASDAIPGLVN